jgi:DNA ligase-1
MDPTGWFISEKLIGVRVYYDGRGRLYVRNGKQVVCPPDVVKGLPLSPLDGVLVGKDYATCSQIISTDSLSDQWKDISFVVTDVPTHHHLRFEERLNMLKQIIPSDHSYTKIGKFTQCNGKEHLASMLYQVKEKDGDGIILRRPRSFYHDKDSLYQAKIFEEAKAVVVSKTNNLLQCKLYVKTWETLLKSYRISGRVLDLAIEPNSVVPTVDTVVSIKHDGVTTDGSLKNAALLRVRSDLKWQDLVLNLKDTPYCIYLFMIYSIGDSMISL